MSEATIADVRGRFAQIGDALSAMPDGGSITVGFSGLEPEDAPMDVVERADRALLCARDQRRRGSLSAVPSANGQK